MVVTLPDALRAAVLAAAEGLPFDPTPEGLYAPEALLAGYDPARPATLADALDLRIFAGHRTECRGARPSAHRRMLEALHDAAIVEARDLFLRDRRVAAIMGGHGLARDDDAYAEIARLAWTIAQDGITMASGGGPGAMEATHLGALFARQSRGELDAAIRHLARVPALPPGLDRLHTAERGFDHALVVALAGFVEPTLELLRAMPADARGESLGIPTWHYGHEPFCPLATHVAKLFQNSVREDGLLAVAQQGIVFAPGAAGTVQELFQDACQNYYRTFEVSSPMVLMGRRFWTETVPLWAPLDRLFRVDPKTGAARPADHALARYADAWVRLEDDVDAIAALLRAFPG
jgi:predicted Rossmann-fold nucleotide-binding protein